MKEKIKIYSNYTQRLHFKDSKVKIILGQGAALIMEPSSAEDGSMTKGVINAVNLRITTDINKEVGGEGPFTKKLNEQDLDGLTNLTNTFPTVFGPAEITADVFEIDSHFIGGNDLLGDIVIFQGY